MWNQLVRLTFFSFLLGRGGFLANVPNHRRIEFIKGSVANKSSWMGSSKRISSNLTIILQPKLV